MIIGMYVKQKEKEMNYKINQLKEVIEKMKKRNQTLTDEIEAFKNREIIVKEDDNEDFINEQIHMDTNAGTNKGTSTYIKHESNQYRSSSQGFARVIRRSQAVPVNMVTSISKIVYRRRNES